VYRTQKNKVLVQVKYDFKFVSLSIKGDKNLVQVSNVDELILVLKKFD